MVTIKELNEEYQKLKQLKYDLKLDIRQWMSDNDYKSKRIIVENDKVVIMVYSKPFTGIDLSKIQYEFNMILTMTKELKVNNKSEKNNLYLIGEYHIWEYWFRI